ncbi:hypothetical protein NPIL_105351 [Nephila pilipes]|uniref:Uncharacterized protein n=1 Tax=Nephila pilipes TaxID=299642 RepID=A0A8X6UFJ3_NEPPI|nr:hypothetical protein NPIL_105351 [Nephila pilipes]
MLYIFTWQAFPHPLFTYPLHDRIGITVVALTRIASSAADRREANEPLQLRTEISRKGIQIHCGRHFRRTDLFEVSNRLILHEGIPQDLENKKKGTSFAIIATLTQVI